MSEERYNQQEADALTQQIAERLALRQQKLDLMEQWQQQGRHTARIRRIYIATAVAASLAALTIVVPMWRQNTTSPIDELGIERPQLTEYRSAESATAEIDRLIAEENYEQALRKTLKALQQSDLVISELLYAPELWDDEEEAKYEEAAEKARNSDLRWTYIYLLVQTGDHKTAKKQLKKYLKDNEYCQHEQEAKELLERLD